MVTVKLPDGSVQLLALLSLIEKLGDLRTPAQILGPHFKTLEDWSPEWL
jgi:hypothetical protein